jgi:hypothetical protein
MPHSLSWSFEDNLRAILPCYNPLEITLSSCTDLQSFLSAPVCKFVIETNWLHEIKLMLKNANINARTVYPDLIGLGKYVGGLIQERLG